MPQERDQARDAAPVSNEAPASAGPSSTEPASADPTSPRTADRTSRAPRRSPGQSTRGPGQSTRGSSRRTARSLAHDHIARLADTVVPALIAKLATLNVGELEVREGDWHIRLQRPGGAGPDLGRRATDRALDRAGQRPHAGHDAVGASMTARAPGAPNPGAPNPGAPTPGIAAGSSGASSNGTAPGNGTGPGYGTALGQPGYGTAPGLAPVGPGRTVDVDGSMDGQSMARGPVATSPAVGIFQPARSATTGARVRAGDRLGVVDMLGIPQDVVAPADGLVIGVLVEPGTAVEYGQELVHLEVGPTPETR